MHNRQDNGWQTDSLKYFGIVSLLPEIFSGWMQYGVIARAVRAGTIVLDYENPRTYSKRSAYAVDDKPYGGGAGMLIQPQPIYDALSSISKRAPKESRCILMAPHGRLLDQQGIDELITAPGIIFICGRYKGIDYRIEEHEKVEVWSVGNYILSGGELAAMIMIESISRHIEGVLGNEESAAQDSFTTGRLDCPHYTRPSSFAGSDVPEILLRGNHDEIMKWRYTQALGRMWEMRPDLMHNIAPLCNDNWTAIFQYLKKQAEITKENTDTSGDK